MGYSVCWVAVRGKTREQVLADLRLKPTGEREEIPEAPLTGAELPGGWKLVFADGFDQGIRSAESLARLSAGAEVIVSAVEEHAMHSLAAGWKDGGCLWSITHESRQGAMHLDIQGNPPAESVEIRNRLEQEQREQGGTVVDRIIDVPVEVARAVTGFRYDADIPARGRSRLRCWRRVDGDELLLDLHLVPGHAVVGAFLRDELGVGAASR